ncbi:MAG: hypothetical protein HQ509_00450 [Candidatus Marinimicrobia bacterium]|nr:hypothetical protein [Candidatus Neomarinimicrobiota bacterium]
MIILNKYSVIIISLILFSSAYGKNWQNSFGLVAGNSGSGISYQKSTKINSNIALGVHTKLYDIKAENEFVVYNRYTGQPEKTSEKYLILIPTFGFINYYPFEGKIENNIAPFITIQSGPLFTLDANEFNDKFFDRWQKAGTYLTIGGHFGVGVDILMQGGSQVTVSAGNDIYPMKKTIDGKTRYGGLALEFSFSKSF